MTDLVKYDAACKALAEAVAVDEVMAIHNRAEAMRHAARIAGDKTLEIQAAQIRFRAQRRFGEMMAEQHAAGKVAKGGRPRSEKTSDESSEVSDEAPPEITLRDLGVTHRFSSQAQKLADIPTEKFDSLVERHAEEMRTGRGRVAMDLLKIDAEEKGRVHRRDLASALSSASAVAPDGRLYPALLCDPPWHRKAGIGNRAYENHYPTMPWPEILDYLKRAGEALLPDAWAWMWIPRAHLLAKVPFKTEVMLADGECVIATVDLPLAYACQLALGMDAYSTCYVWTKTDAEHPDVSGSGLLVWDQDELLLQFKRGRGLPKPESSEKFGSNHRERPREHSRKPDHYRHMVATMVGRDSDGQPLPVLELFARVDAEHPLPENWSAWGNQAGSRWSRQTPRARPSSPPAPRAMPRGSGIILRSRACIPFR
jgi:N6-adenosine-specific RNA methylase IME4